MLSRSLATPTQTLATLKVCKELSATDNKLSFPKLYSESRKILVLIVEHKMRLTQPCLFVVVSLSKTAFQDIVRLLNHQSRQPGRNELINKWWSVNHSYKNRRLADKKGMDIWAVLLAFCKHPRARLTPNGSFIWHISQQESESSIPSGLAAWTFIQLPDLTTEQSFAMLYLVSIYRSQTKTKSPRSTWINVAVFVLVAHVAVALGTMWQQPWSWSFIPGRIQRSLMQKGPTGTMGFAGCVVGRSKQKNIKRL